MNANPEPLEDFQDEIDRVTQPVVPAGNPHQQSSYGLAILVGLDRAPGGPKHVYGGTVTDREKARRRARNRRAKQSRKVNRG